MDRENDCHRWTRLIVTSVNILPKDLHQFAKVQCSGSIMCPNDEGSFYKTRRTRNLTSWSGPSKGDRVFKVGQSLPVGGLTCFHCSIPPTCVESCPARMFYVYPMPGIDRERFKYMSRVAIHMGCHVHPLHSFVPREAVMAAELAIHNQHTLNPGATPACLKQDATESLMAHLAPETASGMSSEDVCDIWNSMMALVSKEKFHAILRTVQMENPLKREFDSIRDMQQNIQFLYILRFLFPGQGFKNDRPHVFKMSTKGPGSRLDILRRMSYAGSYGGPLEGSWVSFDVMHRIHTGWMTFSAHVYDHNIRALCTIFTCELKSECAHRLLQPRGS